MTSDKHPDFDPDLGISPEDVYWMWLEVLRNLPPNRRAYRDVPHGEVIYAMLERDHARMQQRAAGEPPAPVPDTAARTPGITTADLYAMCGEIASGVPPEQRTFRDAEGGAETYAALEEAFLPSPRQAG